MLRACCGPVYCRAGILQGRYTAGPATARHAAGRPLLRWQPQKHPGGTPQAPHFRCLCGPPPPALAATAASRRNTTSASLPLPLRAAPSCAGSHSSTPAEHHTRLTSVASAGRPRSCYTRQTATEQHRRSLRKQPGEAAALHTNTKGKSIQRFAFRRIYTLHLSQNLALTAKNSAPHRARNTNNAQTPQKPSANAKYSAYHYARGTNTACIRQGFTASAKYSALRYARGTSTACIRQNHTANAKYSASHYARSTSASSPGRPCFEHGTPS